jgi:hypothetical protein
VEAMSASVETVEWRPGTTSLLGMGVSLPNKQGSTHSTVSTVSTLIKSKISKYPQLGIRG